MRVKLTKTICLLGCLGALFSATASAAPFGAEGPSAGEFFEPHGIAISEGSGEVLIADRNNHRVDAFSSEGTFLRAFGWGVASAREDLQTCTSTCFEGYRGPGAGEFGGPEGIAVGNDPVSASFGYVYADDQFNHRVQKLTASGEFVSMFGGEVNATKVAEAKEIGNPHHVSEAEENLCTAASGDTCTEGTTGLGTGQFELTYGAYAYGAIAVGPEGNVYVGDLERVQEFSPEGRYIGQLAVPGAGFVTGVAVDSAEDVYVEGSELPGVHEYAPLGHGPGGEELGSPRDEAGSPGSIALNAAGDLFVADGSGHVLEFGPTGRQLASLELASLGVGSNAVRGIAYNESDETIYALTENQVEALPVSSSGPLVGSESVATVQATSATLAASVNPEGPKATSYQIEYGTTPAYGTSTPATALAGGEFDDQPAVATIAHLQPGTTYHFRLVVSNTANETTFGSDETFTTLPAVSIDAESVSAVSARLEGELNPQGVLTEYQFEYGPSLSYGASVPVPPASAGAGTTDTDVDIEVQGLLPGMTYHYRLVARNSLGTVFGTDETFATQGAIETALIDGRAWEMVSSAEKHGVSFEGIAKEGAVIQAAEDGDALTYVANSPITKDPEGNRASANSQVLSSRTGPGAWSNEDIATKSEEVAGLAVGEQSEYKLFSPDLTSGIVEPQSATPLSPQASERTPYRRSNFAASNPEGFCTSGCYEPLVTAANAPGSRFGGEELTVGIFVNGVKLITATPDQSHVLLTSPQPLTPGLEGNGYENVYEWSSGVLQLVSVLPNEEATSQAGEVGRVGKQNNLVRNAVSEDGSRVVFATTRNGSEGHLYLRDLALGKTVQLDAPQAGLKEPVGEPTFQTASSDDSRVFFLDRAKLTADSTAREGNPDLYECEVTVSGPTLGCTLKDLSVDPNPGEVANVLGVLGADESGRYVYFVADGRLAPGAIAGGCMNQTETASSCDLYVRDTVTGSTRLIGVLSSADLRTWQTGEGEDLGTLTSRVSPNGQYLAFMSERPLTNFDNRDVVAGVRDEEVFEYSFGQGTLMCVSCASSGARPRGILDPNTFPGMLVDRRHLWGGRWVAASIPGWTGVKTGEALYQSRYLSDSGRLFFNSATPLVPSDGNGLEDVYEYEPAGTGICELSSGCVGLISSGTSGEEAAFLDASADGSDVFFLTSARLLGSDTDNAYDVYDAHVCSTEAPCASEAAAAPSPCGTADACRAAPSPQPDIFGTAPSQTFSGSGNPTATAKARAKPLTRAQKLTRALKACSKQTKPRRPACKKRALKQYGPSKRAKRSKRKKG
jgi:hypothetical protein